MREGGAKEDDKERIEERKREALSAQSLVAKKKSRFHVIDVICKQEPRASFFSSAGKQTRKPARKQRQYLVQNSV